MALTKIDDRGVTYPLDLLDNEKIRFGTGNDLEIHHDGSQSIINDTANRLQIRSDHIELMTASGKNEYYFQGTEDGAVELYYDNSKKLSTSSSGVEVENGDLRIHLDAKILADGRRLWFGADNDLSIYHDGSDSIISNSTGVLKTHSSHFYVRNAAGNETNIECHPNGAVKLFYDNSTKLQTTSSGFQMYGHLFADDDNKIQLGTSQDLQIYHDGSNNWIKSASGQLKIETVDSLQIFGNNSETLAQFSKDGGVFLYYDNSKKFETKSNGITVIGDIGFANAGSGIDFGANSHASGMSSEKFDSYEEGTWTPTDTSGAGLSFSNVNAWYVKVGSLVTMGARYTYPTTSNTNQNKIGGFPFFAGTNVFSVGSVTVGTVQNPMGNQGSWAGLMQDGRLRTENASIPYNDDISGATVYLSISFTTA